MLSRPLLAGIISGHCLFVSICCSILCIFLWSSVLFLMKIVVYICHLSQPQWIIPMVSILIISLHYLCFVGQKTYDKCYVNQSLFIIWGCIWTRMENSSSESQNLLVFCIVNDCMCLVWSVCGGAFLMSFSLLLSLGDYFRDT